MQKGAHWLGIGTDNVVPVKTDSHGRMMPSDLVSCIQQTISQGKKPFFVSATAGTTVLGAFDPLEQLADICHHYGLWLHVDVSTIYVSIPVTHHKSEMIFNSSEHINLWRLKHKYVILLVVLYVRETGPLTVMKIDSV